MPEFARYFLFFDSNVGTPVILITYFISDESTVFLLSIYDKSEQDVITDSELAELLAAVADA